MVSKDDRPAGGSRPSLLSTEQEGAADGRSVLGALDGKAAKPAKATKPAKPAGQPKPAARPAGSRKPGRGLALWGAVGAGVLALAGGTLAWMASVPDDESVAAVTAPPPAAIAPAARVAAAPTPSAAAQSDVSTAAILQDASGVGTPGAGAAPEKQPSLKEMLAAPSAKAAVRPDPLTQALERPSQKEAEGRKADKPPTGEAVKKEAKKKPAKEQPAREKPKSAPQPKQPPHDKDATVLAALMAHVQPNSQIPRKSTPAQQLKSCRQYNAAGAEQCRARLCAKTAKNEPECKARAKGKATTDS